MRVLIVDSNTVYAKQVSEVLSGILADVVVDLARDAFITRRRLQTNKYDLVIVDVSTVVCQDLLMEELKKHDIPTIAWTVLNAEKGLTDLIRQLGAKLIPKGTVKALPEILPEAVASATGTRVMSATRTDEDM